MRNAAIAVATLLLVAYVLLCTAHPAPTPLPAQERPAPPSATLREALAALDRARAAAYADPVSADPDDWAARTCPCYAEDARRLRALAARGHRLRGQRSTLLSLTVTRAGPARADLLVTDTTSAYATVDARGRTVARWPATTRVAPGRWRVTLVRTGGRWLLGAVARAP